MHPLPTYTHLRQKECLVHLQVVLPVRERVDQAQHVTRCTSPTGSDQAVGFAGGDVEPCATILGITTSCCHEPTKLAYPPALRVYSHQCCDLRARRIQTCAIGFVFGNMWR